MVGEYRLEVNLEGDRPDIPREALLPIAFGVLVPDPRSYTRSGGARVPDLRGLPFP